LETAERAQVTRREGGKKSKMVVACGTAEGGGDFF